MTTEDTGYTPKNNNSKILIGVIIALVLGLLAAGFFLFQQNEKIEEQTIENELIKQELEDEFEDLSVQYETYKVNLKNDSLLSKLDSEQAKVQRLLDELKTVKAENTAEISRLKKELGGLRKILKHYVVQIDSLNKVNESLKKENKEIAAKYQATSQTLNQVAKEKKNLTEKVSLASKLDAVAISVVPANKKGKAQKKIKKVEQIIVNFKLAKNITTQPGDRTIYVRIMKPDNDVLVKSRTNVFPYENKDINYSMKRIVEYGGEEVDVTLFWAVEEYLMPGDYRVDIFADGNLIGSRSFTMTK